VEKSQAAQKLLKVVIAGLSEDAHSEEVRKVCVPFFFFHHFFFFFFFFFHHFFFFFFFFLVSSSLLSCQMLSSVAVCSARTSLLICCHPASVPFGFCDGPLTSLCIEIISRQNWFRSIGARLCQLLSNALQCGLHALYTICACTSSLLLSVSCCVCC